ncbi:MAG: response regulator [Ignavibacteria bacterium]|jgi:DNA-binding response OmpR family regulator|nr:response regulator [Ignavibacteria bacterium]
MGTKQYQICVVEDNAPIRKLYSTLLKKHGFQTEDFPDGKQAIDWLKNNNPDCVLVDILLPDMNGTEILQFVRKKENGDSIPVIAATGFAHSNDRQKFIDIGFDSYIPKPINTATFASDIEDVIRKKNG